MRSRTGTNALSALPVSFKAGEIFLFANRKSYFLSVISGHSVKEINSFHNNINKQFQYEEFLRQNGIQRILVSPYHPSSNSLAERFVQTFKYTMESSADDPASSIQRRLQNFLLSYRSTPHATTGSSSGKLFLQ